MKCKEKALKIKELGIEVETRAHHQGKQVRDIIKDIPKGWRLLKENEFNFLFNNYEKELNIIPNLWDEEIYDQPINKNKKKCPIRRLYRYWDGLYAWDDSLLDSGGNGRVRYCRDLK